MLSTVKTYCETSPALERLSKPNNHVTPKRGNNTMQAFTVVLIKRNWLKLINVLVKRSKYKSRVIYPNDVLDAFSADIPDSTFIYQY